MSCGTLEKMSTEELGEWIISMGFGEETRDAFIDQGMDGEAICLALATTTGPDCLRDVIPKYGLHLKVYRAVKETLTQQNEELSDYHHSSISESTIILSESDGSDTAPTLKHKRRPSSDSTASVLTGDNNSKRYIQNKSGESSNAVLQTGENFPKHLKNYTQKKLFTSALVTGDDSSSSSSSLKGSVRKVSGKVPDPFPIPTFRKLTEINFQAKKLADDDRKYVVRTLATMLCTYVQSPSTADCELVARSLVATHPFLKQHQSWKTFIYNKGQNINRQSPGDARPLPAKRAKCIATKHPYPSIPQFSDDEISYERNVNLLNQESAKCKPNMEVAKELMCRTFPRRRKWILEQERLVSDICNDYPFYKMQSIISSELDCILSVENTRSLFEEKWKKWEPAVIKYASASKSKPTALKYALRDVDGDPEEVTLTAIRCLAYFFMVKNRKKDDAKTEMDVPFILNEGMRGMQIEECYMDTNHPHIIRYINADDEVPSNYIVIIEKRALLQCSSLLAAVFILFAVHYVFNIEYCPKVKDFYLFFQNKLFDIKEATSFSASYINVTSSIECYLEDEQVSE